jgi:hypothetical protein
MTELPIITDQKQDRTCGECQACCWFFALPFLDKPAREKCKYQCDAGCAIHDKERHRVCTEFLCGWRENRTWPDEWRPDKSDILFCHRGGFIRPDRKGKVELWQGYLLRPHADTEGIGPQITYRLNKAGDIILYYRKEDDYKVVRLESRRVPWVDPAKVIPFILERIARDRARLYTTAA